MDAHLVTPQELKMALMCAPENVADVAVKQDLKESHGDVKLTSSKKSRKHRASWHLVWCHEHCHKAETAAVKDKLREAAANHGASMIFFKKSEKYMTWLTTQCSQPHVLIANWREAKPSFQGIVEHEISKAPSAIVVLADQHSIFRRALSWANTCKEVSVSVFQVSALDGLDALLASHREKTDQQQPQVVLKTASPASPQAPEKMLPFLPGALPPTQVLIAANQAGSSLSQSECSPLPTLKLEEAIPAKVPPSKLLAFLMEAVQNQHVAARIQSDLIQSMPETYED